MIEDDIEDVEFEGSPSSAEVAAIVVVLALLAGVAFMYDRYVERELAKRTPPAACGDGDGTESWSRSSGWFLAGDALCYAPNGSGGQMGCWPLSTFRNEWYRRPKP